MLTAMESYLCQRWPYCRMSINITTQQSKYVWKFKNWIAYANSQTHYNVRNLFKSFHIQHKAVIITEQKLTYYSKLISNIKILSVQASMYKFAQNML